MLAHEQVKADTGFADAIGGGAGNGTGGPELKRPKDMPSKADADAVVRNQAQLVRAVRKDNQIVYIDANISLNGLEKVQLGRNITLVGGYCDPNRTENGGRGPVLRCQHYVEHVFETRGSLTLWGVSMRGPNRSYFDPWERAKAHPTINNHKAWATTGIWAYPHPDRGAVKAIGCEFWGWTYAGLAIGAKDYRSKAVVTRCTFHDCLMEGYGYGIEHFRGDIVLDRCFFDSCRHGFSGFGYADESVVAIDCVYGPGPWAGHAHDMHCLANNIDVDSNVAGEFTHLIRCSFMSTKDVDGSDQEGFALRGVSSKKSKITKCDFWHEKEPTKPNVQGQAYRQEAKQWTKFDRIDNAFGGENWPKYGAPRADDDTPGGPADDEHDELRVIGYHRSPTTYTLVIEHDGDAAVTGRKLEANDEINEHPNGSIVTGVVTTGVDIFAVPTDADITEAWVVGTARVERDGSAVDLSTQTTRAMDKRVKELQQHIASLENKLENAEISFSS